MKYLNTFLIIIAVGLFLSCSNHKEPQGVSTPVPGSEANQSVPAVQPASQDSMAPFPNLGATTQASAPQTATAPGKNPPHGQPNHRCDIPVGAPLNSPPGKLPPVKTTTPVNAQQTTTAPGMNPPHGQPNHRCDIAVGAPLNSPPGKKPEVTQTIGPSTTQDNIKPKDSLK